MAIATLQGHVQRAIDFYRKEGKYFVIGGTTPWLPDDADPDQPRDTDYKLRDIVGYKRVDECTLVRKVTQQEIDTYGYENLIEYRTQKWKRVDPPFTTTVGVSGISASSKVVPLNDLKGMNIGNKIRIANLYEGVIVSKDERNNQVTLDQAPSVYIPGGSLVEAGAIVEGARYVYVHCYLNYDQFPIPEGKLYRQIGLCSEVKPNLDILRAAKYNQPANVDEFTSLGVLEVIDNRVPSSRDIEQRELLSLILEY